jgi:hypothetical protein
MDKTSQSGTSHRLAAPWHRFLVIPRTHRVFSHNCLDSANVAWILPQNEGEGDADADALQIRRLIDAQVNAVLSLEARGWLPEKIGLHESPYDMAADNIISGESPEIVSNLDQLELPFKAMMILDATIRAGFPEFIQDVYL